MIYISVIAILLTELSRLMIMLSKMLCKMRSASALNTDYQLAYHLIQTRTNPPG